MSMHCGQQAGVALGLGLTAAWAAMAPNASRDEAAASAMIILRMFSPSSLPRNEPGLIPAMHLCRLNRSESSVIQLFGSGHVMSFISGDVSPARQVYLNPK